MSRPAREVADLVRPRGRPFLERAASGSAGSTSKSYWPLRGVALPPSAGTSMSAPAVDIVQWASARDRWLQARRQELLPTRYVRLVFTLPRELAPLALQNKKVPLKWNQPGIHCVGPGLPGSSAPREPAAAGSKTFPNKNESLTGDIAWYISGCRDAARRRQITNHA
jgi:hypothetical protein